MIRKIITYFLILAVVLPVFASAVPLPFSGQVLGVNIAYAEDVTKKTSGNVSISDPCGTSVIEEVKTAASTVLRFGGLYKEPGGSIWDCAAYTIVNLLYKFLMKIAIWLAGGLASTLFNISIQFSLTGEIFDADKNTMIKDGWTLVRDLLNLVFIFILLYAAISTILQYGGVDIKKVLPGLIVAALLVNFSLMISKMVIDASHIFAWEFYNQIDVTSGGTLPEIKDSANVKGDFKKKNLANVFMAGFNPQRLLIENQMSETTETEKTPWKEIVNHATKKGDDGQPAESLMATLWRMALIILLESALALFAAFILLAGAIMFVARTVVLWLVMIFSPIAFLSMILPSMGKYSKMWWDYLIGQSFFAPAFLFMFMLSTKLIDNKLVDNLLELTGNDNSKIAIGMSLGGTARIFFNFLIVGFIMSLSLVVARKLGGKTAEFGISGAHRVKSWALGAPGKAFNNRLARWGYGQLADKTLDKKEGWGEKKWAKTLSAIPGVGIGLRKLGAMKKTDEDKARKAAEKHAGTLSKAGRESLEREIEGTKGIRGFAKRFIYTGPEGAFKPGKEGYEKVIAKKKEEEKEKDLYYESWAYLLGDLKHGKVYDDEVKKEIIKKIKERIQKEGIGKMEEEADKKQKEREINSEKTKNDNNLKVIEKNREIRMLEAELREQINKGSQTAADLTRAAIAGYDVEIAELNKANNQITVIEKSMERHEKKVESYRTRQDIKSGKPQEEKKEKKEKSE